jgi:hypothetical protein
MWWLGFWWRFKSLKFQFPVLKSLDKTFNNRKGLYYLALVRCANLEVPIRLKFVRSFAERLPQALTKLQLGFALCRITIRESLLADVIDCRQNFLKLVDSVRNLFDGGGLRSGSLMFSRACPCHGGVKKSNRGSDTWQENKRF